MLRPIGSLCSLLLVWVLALGAGPAQHSHPADTAARSAAELALRDLAEAPQLAPRVVASRVTVSRPVERGGPHRHSPVASLADSHRGTVEPSIRIMLDRQEMAHASRPRWQAYDAAAPPAPSRSAR